MTKDSNQESTAPKAQILVVEDDDKNIMILEHTLKAKNYSIIVATNGQDAMEKAHQYKPDLILLDIMIPAPNGYDVCKHLKSSDDTKEIPIIFLTGLSSTDNIVEGFDQGGVDYLIKPFNREELLARINTHLSLKKAKEDLLEMERKMAVMAMAVTTNHEINQPLTVLKGSFEIYKGLIQNEPITDKKKACLDRMGDSIDKIQVILKKFIQKKSDVIDFDEYIDGQKMVVFKDT